MKSRIPFVAAAVFSALFIMAGRAQADVTWSSIATACMPDSTSIQDNRYTSAAESNFVTAQAKNVDPIVLVCPVVVNGSPSPDILSMTYLDSTGTATSAKVQAQFIRINRTTGARAVIATVNSDSFASTTATKQQSAPLSGTLNPSTFFYFVRIVIDRAVASQTVRSIGVALEVTTPIASFGPALSYARVGETANAPTFPIALTVTLRHPATTDTTVTVVSSNPATLAVNNVVIPQGNISANVPVTAIAQDANVTVTATLQLQSINAHVRVLGVAEVPSSVTLSPPNATIGALGTVQFTVTLDIPAMVGGATVNLVATPDAGTHPPTITIPANQKNATFSYTDNTGLNTTITATFGSSTSTTNVTVN